MARVAFIGLGNMGGGMAANLAKAGHEVIAFDLSEDALARAATNGCTIAESAEQAVADIDAVVTMLPAGKHVAEVYRKNVLINAPKTAILIDCSTIDVATAKQVEDEASFAGFTMVDARHDVFDRPVEVGKLLDRGIALNNVDAVVPELEDATRPTSAMTWPGSGESFRAFRTSARSTSMYSGSSATSAVTSSGNVICSPLWISCSTR